MSDSDHIYAPRLNTAAKVATQRLAVSATSAAVALQPNLAKTGWVYITAQGADVDFAIDAAGGTLVKDAVGGGTTVGQTLASGQTRRYYISLVGAAGFVTAIASGAGFLSISRAGVDRAGF